MTRDTLGSTGPDAEGLTLTSGGWVFRPDRPGIRKVLGDLEADIMDVVWAKPAGNAVSVREVFEDLYARRRIAYTTVMTTMARLAKKGLLRVHKGDQAYLYAAAAPRDTFISRVVGRILADLLTSFTGPTLKELEALTQPEAQARLQALAEELERARRHEP